MKTVISVSGFSMLKSASSPNAGLVIGILEDWDERPEGVTLANTMRGMQAKFNAMSEFQAILLRASGCARHGERSGI